MTLSNSRSNAFSVLVLAGVITFFLPMLPFGRQILYPFMLLTTFVHEMGHGLGAIFVGGNFVHLEIYSNGGGVAYHSGSGGGLSRAFVSALGLLGPPIAGGIFILAGRSVKASSRTFYIFAFFVLISVLLWTRNGFGFFAFLVIGLALIYIANRTSAEFHQFMIQFLGVQMCVDTLTRSLSYMMSSGFTRGGKVCTSDTANIAKALGGTYWFWGAIIAGIAVIILFSSLYIAYLRPQRK